MAADDKIQAPPTGEIAQPDSMMQRTGANLSPFTDILTPKDTVLMQKGGIANLAVYTELLRDDQVRSTWQQRRYGVTQAETMVEPGGEDAASQAAAEALREELKRLRWDDITDKAMYAVFYGWSVAEVLWENRDGRVAFAEIKIRDRARFRFGQSGALYLLRPTGPELMPARKFWTISTGADNDDLPYGLGIAHSLYWPVYFKRNDIKFWLVFLERFGQPTAIATLPAGSIEDPDTKRKALEMLQSIATDSGVVIPDNVVVTLLEAARSGSADYAGMQQAMDKAISKIVLSQTMTTDDGASLSQAKVHGGVKDDVVKADADLICESFNRGPVQWWTEWNFPGAKPPRVYRHTQPPEDLNTRAERDNKIAALGFEPSEEYIRETYGEGWKKKEQQQAPAIPGSNPADPASFAEGESAALNAIKAARRQDQQALVDAATAFATQYETIMGRRVGALLRAAEFSDDYSTFRQKLDEIMAEVPPEETVDKLERASLFSRLLGAFRNQRKAA